MLGTLKKNIKNKYWWVAIISAGIVLAQSFGFDLTKYIGTDWQTRLNTMFSILVLLGISVDTTAVATTNSTESTIQADSNSTNTNSNVSSDSTDTSNASSKIEVVNPDNGIALDKQVSATNAAQPN